MIFIRDPLMIPTLPLFLKPSPNDFTCGALTSRGFPLPNIIYFVLFLKNVGDYWWLSVLNRVLCVEAPVKFAYHNCRVHFCMILAANVTTEATQIWNFKIMNILMLILSYIILLSCLYWKINLLLSLIVPFLRDPAIICYNPVLVKCGTPPKTILAHLWISSKVAEKNGRSFSS